eukprot:6197436-Pleurochrysis_carterae.AAC.1
METLKSTHADTIAVKQTEFDTSIRILRGQIDEEVTAHRLIRTELETVKAEKTMLVERHAASLREMEESHAAAIAVLTREKDTEITRLKNEIVNLKNQHAEAIENLNDKHINAISAKESQINALQGENKVLTSNLERQTKISQSRETKFKRLYESTVRIVSKLITMLTDDFNFKNTTPMDNASSTSAPLSMNIIDLDKLITQMDKSFDNVKEEVKKLKKEVEVVKKLEGEINTTIKDVIKPLLKGDVTLIDVNKPLRPGLGPIYLFLNTYTPYAKKAVIKIQSDRDKLHAIIVDHDVAIHQMYLTAQTLYPKDLIMIPKEYKTPVQKQAFADVD